MTDEAIRKAFDTLCTTGDGCYDEDSFTAGYRAAMERLEQVAFQEYTEDGNSYYLVYSRYEGRTQVPLYRIKDES
jgi:hypothetical protein